LVQCRAEKYLQGRTRMFLIEWDEMACRGIARRGRIWCHPGIACCIVPWINVGSVMRLLQSFCWVFRISLMPMRWRIIMLVPAVAAVSAAAWLGMFVQRDSAGTERSATCKEPLDKLGNSGRHLGLVGMSGQLGDEHKHT